jgi:uncharacterized protein
MNLDGQEESENVEDRRGMRSSGGKLALGGGAMAILFFVIKMFVSPENAQLVDTVQNTIQQNQSTGAAETGEPEELTEEQKAIGTFSKRVIRKTEITWDQIFAEMGSEYEKPGTVLFSENVQTACGGATSASGPFYCPGDKKVYMDLEFMKELKTRFGAQGGDFALAYILAHEVGHHVQNILGTSDKMRQAQQGKSEAIANKLSVCLELQADFYAGVWAHYNKQYLEEGDLEEALSAAHAVGDDAIQSKMQGQVVPDSFTHGSSEQRIYWFRKGYESGDIRQGDTFSALLR